ncbi:6-phospho-3-hexuloisomerase [Paenibacillus cellulosilyticus]|uniref:6-phospho-3-hexuloisomerase n=1 Tax=Paenibacillus cellulosilyticus TaxID=375489 RepID=A0A2V2YMS9_9BACL|nr:6-phospho-3-hexuloisomerase [Paenibacillus cellulosilyticus]PWV95579.1 6-phospho-3-hexuloisomerase [Paenibacillus cellulosilyticus]QKS47348.1 6-phospho-3-hexuloisomerase [Paenibacillus cellulosilyticus]
MTATAAAPIPAILLELQRTLQSVDELQINKLAEHIIGAGTVFVAGAGRSGLMMRAFAMRLMHLGIRAYVVGETVTPGIAAGDLLLIGSGSGETKGLVSMASKAQSLQATVAAITVVPESTIGSLAAALIHVPAATKEAGTTAASIQPMGSLFEQSMLLVLDAVVLRLMERTGLRADAMFGNHANLE